MNDTSDNLDKHFQHAVKLVETGDYHSLRVLLMKHPKLATKRDETSATLLIRLIDYPGNRPNAHKTARVLLVAGCDVDARRDESNGTALAGVLSTGEIDVARVLLEFGANFRAKLGFKKGDVIDLAIELCSNDANENSGFSKAIRELVADFTGLELG